MEEPNLDGPKVGHPKTSAIRSLADKLIDSTKKHRRLVAKVWCFDGPMGRNSTNLCVSSTSIFLCPSPVPFGGSTVLETHSSTTSRRGAVPGGNRSAASCPCTVLRRASYHYATRSPTSSCGRSPWSSSSSSHTGGPSSPRSPSGGFAGEVSLSAFCC